MRDLRVLGMSHRRDDHDQSRIGGESSGQDDERHTSTGSEASPGRGVRKRTSDPAPGARSRSWSAQGQAAEGLRTHRRGGARRRAQRHQRLRRTRRSALEHSSGHGPHRPSPFRSKRHARAPRPAEYVRRPLECVAIPGQSADCAIGRWDGSAGRDGRPVGAGCSAHQEDDALLPASRSAVGARRPGAGCESPLAVASRGAGWP